MANRTVWARGNIQEHFVSVLSKRSIYSYDLPTPPKPFGISADSAPRNWLKSGDELGQRRLNRKSTALHVVERISVVDSGRDCGDQIPRRNSTHLLRKGRQFLLQMLNTRNEFREDKAIVTDMA